MSYCGDEKQYIKFFEEYQTTHVVFGDGAMAQLGGHLLMEGVKCAMIVIGGKASSLESGAFSQFMNEAMSLDLQSPLYKDVPAEPDTDCVRDILKQMEQDQPDAVIAIGGGSVLDAAKAAYISWQTGMDVSTLFGVNKASDAFPDKKFKRVICVPTTAGTGSEVTPYSNIVDRNADVKRLIMDKAIVPELALVDPAFTISAPENLTLATAFDALAHSIESFLNTKAANADPRAGDWAVESIRLIAKALPYVVKNPEDLQGRERVAAASVLGGMCIKNRPTGLPHLSSFSFYGKAPHGIVVAALLPAFWRYYLKEPAVREVTMLLANIFPSEDTQKAPEQVVNAYEQFFVKLTGIDALSKLPGFDAAMIARVAAAAKENPMKLQSAPRPVDPAQAEKTLTDILTAAL